MASDARRIIDSVLGGHMTSQVWTSNYTPVFPFTPQDFSVGALLPMVLYLFRWGHRRGAGQFKAAFGESGAPTIRSVVDRLVREPNVSGFEGATPRSIMGDLFLTSTIENKRHSEGHDEQIQRCFASHYMASWIDLPTSAANLRGVPEMLTALLNGQGQGEHLDPFQERGRYRVGCRVQENELLQALAPGISTTGSLKNDLRADQFDESVPLPLDQLFMVRMAQVCGEAPRRAVGKGEPGPIPNQRPIAVRAAEQLRQDLLVFLDCYARSDTTPRSAFLGMLESAFAVGLTTIMLSTVDIMTHWSETGAVRESEATSTYPVLFACSNGTDLALRDASEQSSGLLRQALSQLPAILMYARLLDYYVRTEADVPRADLPSRSPDGTAWLQLLGSFLNGTHDEARDAEKFFRAKARALREAAAEEQDAGSLSELLRDEVGTGSHGRALAEGLSASFSASALGGRDPLYQFVSSALMTDEVNGLAKRRKITLTRVRGKGQTRTSDAVSFVLTNTAIEYVVHRHLRRNGRGRKATSLSYPDFLRILRERYGFYVDQAPPNMQIPSELLQRNRRMLEHRLRDLGLLSGVNDAERMKKLRARYRAVQDANDQIAEPA